MKIRMMVGQVGPAGLLAPGQLGARRKKTTANDCLRREPFANSAYGTAPERQVGVDWDFWAGAKSGQATALVDVHPRAAVGRAARIRTPFRVSGRDPRTCTSGRRYFRRGAINYR